MKASKNFQRVVIVAIILLALHTYGSIVFPLLFAIIISIALLQPTEWLENKGIPKSISAFMVMLLPLILFAGLGVFYYYQFQAFGEALPELETTSTEALENLNENLEEETQMEFNLNERYNNLKKDASTLFQNGKAAIASTLSAFSSFVSFLVLTPVYIFFLLISKNQILSFFEANFKDRNSQKVDDFIQKSKKSMLNYFKGLGLVVIIVAILNTTALYIIGIDYALLLGTFSALLIVIPYIGVAIGALLPILFAFITKDSLSYPIYVAMSYAVVQFLEGNIISPKLLGESVELNPLVIILFLVFMGFIGGVVAMIIAVPFLSLIKIALEHSESMKSWGILLSSKSEKKK